MADDALLELTRRAADAADEARTAAQAVAKDLSQLDHRVSRLEGASGGQARPASEPGLLARLLDKVVERPVVLLYLAGAIVIVMVGAPALQLLLTLTGGLPHGTSP